MIERKEYLDQLKRFKDKDLIKVVTGIRRCGKSTLFDLFIHDLKENGIKNNQIIKVNLEDATYHFNDAKELYDYDSLYIKKNVDVYITGSNAYLLSGELATLLSGRYIEIKMLPLSFQEYLNALEDNMTKSRYEYFLDYMKNGGMPGNISIVKEG